jgi:hypothetical protein
MKKTGKQQTVTINSRPVKLTLTRCTHRDLPNAFDDPTIKTLLPNPEPSNGDPQYTYKVYIDTVNDRVWATRMSHVSETHWELTSTATKSRNSIVQSYIHYIDGKIYVDNVGWVKPY